jgi:hypothetical protein
MHILADMIALIGLAIVAGGAWGVLEVRRVLKPLFFC